MEDAPKILMCIGVEGSKIEPLWVRSRTQTGSKIEPLWVRVFEPRRVRRSNPEGSIFEPSGFHEPRGFVLRTLWVPRTQKGSYLRTLLGSRSNPEGSIFEPSGFHEPRRVRNPGGFDLRTLLGSWNPEGSRSNLEGSRSNPEGFDLEPSGFEERTLWVRGTQRVRRSNPLGSRSNPEGFDLRTLLGSRWNPEGFEDMNPSGFEDTNPEGFDLRTLLGSRWNPEGFEDMNPSGFEDTNPEGFDLRTLLGSRSNPEGFDLRTQRGSIFEPSGFDLEPRGFVVLRTLLGSRSNPEGFEDMNPSGFEDTNPEGFDLRTLWVRSRTQRVRRSSKMNFEDEVHLRTSKKIFFFFSWWRSRLDLHPPSTMMDGGDPIWISTINFVKMNSKIFLINSKKFVRGVFWSFKKFEKSQRSF
ncbi:hypothetical protein ACOSP7_020463 [Xanthoceras sorbifolium]